MHPEHHTAIRDKFTLAVSGLLNSRNDVVTDVTRTVVDRISDDEIIIGASIHQENDAPATDIYISGAQDSPLVPFWGVLVLHPDHILTGSIEDLQSDLVRTLYIASLFPVNGYERRLSDVYRDALGFQQNWLEAQKAPPVRFDPRTHYSEEIIQSLIGDKSYFTDTGFDDWQQAIKKVRSDTPEHTKDLDALYNDVRLFVAMRHRFGDMLYDAFVSKQGQDALHAAPKEYRAKSSAYTLIGIYLYSRKVSHKFSRN